MCASDAYHFGNGLCLSSCPYGFMEDSQYHLCFFDVEALTQPQLQLSYLNQNCSSEEYTVAGSGVCNQCDHSCQTCVGGSPQNCTSCSIGLYLNEGQCLACDPQGMIMGSSGECNEICGDGLNFGLNQCDDGNTLSGDGCSSTCQLEANWDCSGGSPT